MQMHEVTNEPFYKVLSFFFEKKVLGWEGTSKRKLRLTVKLLLFLSS